MSKALMAECLAEALELLLDSTALSAEEEPQLGELTAVATIAVALYQERMRLGVDRSIPTYAQAVAVGIIPRLEMECTCLTGLCSMHPRQQKSTHI